MAIPKKGETRDGKLMHFSAGVLIEQDGKYLLIDRTTPPFGFAGVAGHIDEGEDERQAAMREVKEETGLEASDTRLLFKEELDWNWCNKGVDSHYWYLFECSVSGEIKRSEREAKSVGWYSKDEIKTLKLEPVWEYWFKKLNII